jgi:hypothetical protein
MTENITIPKSEYLRLKKMEKVDNDLLLQLAQSLQDIKKGRIERVA